MNAIKVQFDCPYCGKEITVQADLLSPEVYIKCIKCKNLIPAGVFYESGTASE